MVPSPELTPALRSLRAAFNEAWPRRDKASDGWIGDAAHQGSQSDHNDDETGNVPIHDADTKHEVHAIDVDKDLDPDDPGAMERVVQNLVAQCRTGAERRLRYIIFNRRIWSATTGWATRAYAGSNPHDHHAHFSGSYETALEADGRPWDLQEDSMTPDQYRQIVREELARERPNIVREVWKAMLDVDVTQGGENMQPAGSILAYTSSEHHRIEGKVDTVLARLPQVPPGR